MYVPRLWCLFVQVQGKRKLAVSNLLQLKWGYCLLFWKLCHMRLAYILPDPDWFFQKCNRNSRCRFLWWFAQNLTSLLCTYLRPLLGADAHNWEPDWLSPLGVFPIQSATQGTEMIVEHSSRLMWWVWYLNCQIGNWWVSRQKIDCGFEKFVQHYGWNWLSSVFHT